MASFTMSARAPALARPVAARSAMRPAARRASLTIVAAKGGEEGGVSWDKSVYGRVGSSGRFNILASSIASCGLDKELMGEGPFTIFAPDDDTFGDACKALGTTKMELRNLASLPDIIKNHVVKGKVTSADLTEGMEATTVGGGKLKFTLGGGAKVNGVTIKKADVSASNGVIHVISGVITP